MALACFQLIGLSKPNTRFRCAAATSSRSAVYCVNPYAHTFGAHQFFVPTQTNKLKITASAATCRNNLTPNVS